MKPVKQKPLPFRYVLLISFAFFILSTTLGLWIVNIAIKPPLMAFAESQSINLATYVMNKAIREEIGNGLGLEDVIKVISYNNNHTLTTFDTAKIIDLSTRITDNVLKNINAVEEGKTFSTGLATNGEIEIVESHGEGIQFKIPFGRITDNILLANLGPDIPVQFKAIGEIKWDIRTEKQSQQINSNWFEIWLDMEVGIQMIEPFISEIKIIPLNVLLAAGEIKGEVPQFYSEGGHLTPSIVLPSEKNE